MPDDLKYLNIRILQITVILIVILFFLCCLWIRKQLGNNSQWKSINTYFIDGILTTYGFVSSKSILHEYFLGSVPRSEIQNFYLEKQHLWNLRLEKIPGLFSGWAFIKQPSLILSFANSSLVKRIIDFRESIKSLGSASVLKPQAIYELIEFLSLGIQTDTQKAYSVSLQLKGEIEDNYLARNKDFPAWVKIIIPLSQPYQEIGDQTSIPCFILTKINSSVDDCIKLTELIQSQRDNGRCLLIVSAQSFRQEVRYYIKERIGKIFAYDLILIDLDDILNLNISVDNNLTLRQIIIKQIDLSKISPFTLTGPTPNSMFYGREQELRQIVEGITTRSFAVVGGRRIGKSSMLIRLHQLLLPAADIHSVYLDMSVVKTYEDFISLDLTNSTPNPFPQFPISIAELLKLSRMPINQHLVLLLDEADKIVPQDRGENWLIFKTLRALANSGKAQVVLSGEQSLREAIRDPQSPLFNFTNEIILRPLDFHASEALIKQSMKILEIELEDEMEIIRKIFNYTAGHPNIIQRLCHRLVEAVNIDTKHMITVGMVDKIIASPNFQRDDFLSTIWESASPLEKIISLVLVTDRTANTLHGIRQALEKHIHIQPKAKEIDDALQRLVDLRSLLRKTQNGYEFIIRAFPDIVQESLTLEDMLEVLAEEYMEQKQ